MSANHAVESMHSLALLWSALFAVMLGLTWFTKRMSVGLPLAYAFNISLIHFSGALAYCHPRYKPMHQVLLDNYHSITTTLLGFQQAVWGLAGMVGGVVAANFIIARKHPAPTNKLTGFQRKIPYTLFILSLVFFFILFPVMRLVPSLGSLGSTGVGLSMLAMCLLCWQSVQLGQHKQVWVYLVVSAVGFPAFTLFFMGFTSFGVAASMVVWLFTMAIYKPRWLCIVAILGLVFMGFSVYVNYMRERGMIRDAVWGSKDASSRVDSIAGIFTKFEFFDWNNNAHLETLDSRLNQNHLVGMAMLHINSGAQDYARGSTLYLAAIAWIPRVLWPNKPSTAGGGGLVSLYTGLKFEKGTSVGVGHLMELFINFGTIGVGIGCFVIVLLLRWMDINASYYLLVGDYAGFIKWFLPCIGMLNVTGNFATVVASMAAAVVFAYLLNRVILAPALANSEWQERYEASRKQHRHA
jgi:hypothetical protein